MQDMLASLKRAVCWTDFGVTTSNELLFASYGPQDDILAFGRQWVPEQGSDSEISETMLEKLKASRLTATRHHGDTTDCGPCTLLAIQDQPSCLLAVTEDYDSITTVTGILWKGPQDMDESSRQEVRASDARTDRATAIRHGLAFVLESASSHVAARGLFMAIERHSLGIPTYWNTSYVIIEGHDRLNERGKTETGSGNIVLEQECQESVE